MLFPHQYPSLGRHQQHQDPLVPPEAIDQADERSLCLLQSPSAPSELAAHPAMLPQQQGQKTPGSREPAVNLPVPFTDPVLQKGRFLAVLALVVKQGRPTSLSSLYAHKTSRRITPCREAQSKTKSRGTSRVEMCLSKSVEATRQKLAVEEQWRVPMPGRGHLNFEF